MATMTSHRFAMEEIKRALEYISVAHSYGTDVATVKTNIFGREDARTFGALPAVGFMPGRSVPQYESFGEMRCTVPVTITAAIASTDWDTSIAVLDKLEDDIIAALMNVPVLGNSLVSILWMGSESDLGSPDTPDSHGGTMAMVMYFDVIFRRSKDRAITA